MADQQIVVARIYLREAEHLLSKVMNFLHDEKRVAGVTVSRGITGFGADGKIHTASLLDLSLDLPLIVEFYDQPERVKEVIAGLMKEVQLSHVITWPATLHQSDA